MGDHPNFSVSTGTQGSETRPARLKKNALVALNFRVPFEFRQRMKLAATVRGVTMTELLDTALADYLRKIEF